MRYLSLKDIALFFLESGIHFFPFFLSFFFFKFYFVFFFSFFFFFTQHAVPYKGKQCSRGGRKRLPKFKFSAKFPIGLHVILQIQIKKFENDCYLM